MHSLRGTRSESPVSDAKPASRLLAEFCIRYPDVPWAKVVAFRNFVVHAHFGQDWAIVWETITHNALDRASGAGRLSPSTVSS